MAEQFKDKIFESKDKPSIKNYQMPPARNFLVENIDGKMKKKEKYPSDVFKNRIKKVDKEITKKTESLENVQLAKMNDKNRKLF